MTAQAIPKSALHITEEVFNSVVHGLGTIAAIVGLTIGLLTFNATTSFVVSFWVYGVCLILLLAMSTLYHALKFTRARTVFRVLDHSGIFLLIAGSFTPFIVVLYSGVGQAALLVAIWAAAITGVVFKATLPKIMSRYGVGIYIALGWMALVLLPKLSSLAPLTIWLLVAGGVLYTVGAILLVIRAPFVHTAWHVFVLAAAAAHFLAVLQLA